MSASLVSPYRYGNAATGASRLLAQGDETQSELNELCTAAARRSMFAAQNL